MKALALSGVVALCVLACNRPDSAIFGPDVPDTGDMGGGGTDEIPSGGSQASGGSSSNGGSGAQPGAGTAGGGSSNGGTEPGGGTSSGGSTNVGGEPTDPGAAGEGMGGTLPDPPDPVCGNGIIEKGEECDDAGQAGMDACMDCKVRCEHYGAGTLKSDDFHCYRGYDQASFEGAVQACEERGAHLVTITSAAENTVVRQLVNSSKFIGAFEDVDPMVEGEGVYGWVTKEPLSYTNWSQGEPDQDDYSCSGWGNQRCYEHCVIMNGQGTWEDHRCDQPDGYVCEWEPVQAPR